MLRLTAALQRKLPTGRSSTRRHLSGMERRQKLVGEGNVRITKDDTIAVGDKIESTDGFQNFKLMGHAHITKGRAQ